MRERNGEAGFAGYFLVIVVILAMGTALAARGGMESLVRERPRERAALAAHWAAEGGVAAARSALARDPAWAGGEVPVGRGTAAVTVRPVDGDRRDLREIVVVATDPGNGTESGRARKRVTALVRLGRGLPEIVGWREE